MKILLLTDYYPPDRVGGVGVIAKELKAAYEDLGHEVHVLTSGPRRTDDLRRNVHRTSPKMLWALFLNNFRALRLIRREGFSLVHMHHASSTVFLLSLWLQRVPPFVLDSLQVSYRSEAREIRTFTVRGYRLRPRLREWVEKLVTCPIHTAMDWLGYKLSDAVTVVSRQNREELVTEFGKPRKGGCPFVIPNGAGTLSHLKAGDPGFRDAVLEERLTGKTVLLNVGVFRVRKRVQNLLFSMQDIVPEFPEARLVLVGGGRGYEDSLCSLARQLGIEDAVELVGSVPHERIGYYLGLSDIFCLLSSYEGMPMALLEAMRAGKAVVATDCYGMRDILSGEDAGLLVPVDDIPATSEALKHLLADPERRAALGRSARQLARSQFSWTKIAEQYLEAFGGHGSQSN